MSKNATRRQAERSILMIDPLLLDKDGRVMARVADISTEGALLYAKGLPFAVGEQISGWLDAPALGDMDEEFVAVWMKVVWAQTETRNWFRCGCVFEPSDAKERRRLERLIQELKSPLGERLTIQTPPQQ